MAIRRSLSRGVDRLTEIQRTGMVAGAGVSAEHGEREGGVIEQRECQRATRAETSPPPVQTHVDRDAQQPRTDKRGIAERIPRLPCAQNGLLRCVLSIRAADQSGSSLQHRRQVRRQQRGDVHRCVGAAIGCVRLWRMRLPLFH
jgi:hypothetical protein